MLSESALEVQPVITSTSIKSTSEELTCQAVDSKPVALSEKPNSFNASHKSAIEHRLPQQLHAYALHVRCTWQG